MDYAYNFPKEKTQLKIPITTPAEVANSSNGSRFAETAPTEAETTFAEVVTAPTHSVVALAMVPEIEGSHKDYLTIFGQIKNLMPNIFPPSKRTHFKCPQPAVTAMIDSCDSSYNNH